MVTKSNFLSTPHLSTFNHLQRQFPINFSPREDGGGLLMVTLKDLDSPCKALDAL